MSRLSGDWVLSCETEALVTVRQTAATRDVSMIVNETSDKGLQTD
jgi:hypothetical protein